MSDFKFACPKCGQSIVCDTSNAGMQIPCPTCQNVLTVPAPPPVARATQAPGKLSISKSAPHHSPPPPGAANAPAQPAWGAKPAPPPRPAKKFPVVPVVATVVVLIVLAVGWFGFGAPYLNRLAEEKKQAEEAAARQAAEEQAKAAAEAAKARRAKAEWNLDLSDAKFPERSASGKLHGQDFKVDLAVFQNGYLILRQTGGSPCQFQVGVPLKTGEILLGQSFEFAPTNTVSVPRVAMNWKEESPKPPGVQVFAKGYAMKLEFGEADNMKVPGKIYLCLPDDAQSFVAGDFEIGPRKPGGPHVKRPPEGQPGAEPGRHKRQPGTQPPAQNPPQ